MTEQGSSAAGQPRGSPAKALALVRIGLGIVWSLNLVFILDPANQFFASFSGTAQAYAPTTLGGPGLATFVASHGELFSGAIAVTTAYLAVGFLLGLTTRLAAVVGLVFNSSLLVSQFGGIVVIPGGTDVGPMPLYLVLYLGLLAAGGPTLLSVDAWRLQRQVDATTSGRPGSPHGLRRSPRWARFITRRPDLPTNGITHLLSVPSGRRARVAEEDSR